MAKPWEKYGGASAKPAGKPWERYGAAGSGASLGTASGQVESFADRNGIPFLSSPESQRAYADTQIRNAPGRVANLYQGLTLGFGDELAGVAGGTLAALSDPLGKGGFDRGYAATRDAVRNTADAYAAENPESALALRLVGGAPSALMAAPRALVNATGAAKYLGAAAYGGAVSGVAGFGEGEGGLGNRLASAGEAATVGAVVGPVLEGVVSGFRALLTRRVPFRVLDPNGQLTPAGAGILRDAGADPAQLPPGFLQRLDAVAERAGGAPANPMAAFRMAQAESTPVPIPLTTGQAADDVTQLATERALSRAGGGMGMMSEFQRAQQEAIGANIPAMRERIAGGFPVVGRGEGAETVSADVVGKAGAAKRQADALYSEARRLDREGAASRVPFAPVDEAQMGVGPNVDGMIPEATADLRFAAAPADRAEPGIIHTIQKMGGIRLTDRNGRLTSEGGDIRAIFDGKFPPGLVNNRDGKTLDYIREALGEQGWFPGRDPQSVTTADVLDMIGGRARNPNVARGSTREAAMRDRLRSEISGAGITRGMPEDTAAGRLAMSRYEDPPIERVQGGGNVPNGGAVAAAGFGGDEAGNVLGGLYQELRDSGHYLRTLPRIQAEMQDLTRTLQTNGQLDVGRVFQALKNFSAVAKSGGEDAVAAGVAKSYLTRALDDGLNSGLLEGDANVIAAYKAARSNYRDYAGTFKADDFVGDLVARDYKNNGRLKVEPREAVNYIFGSANLGFLKQRDFARNLVNLRNVLGEDSQAWNAMKQEAFNRFADAALGQSTQNGRLFSGANFAKAWEGANSDEMSRHILRLLFSDAERRDIGNLAQVMRRATTADPNVYTPSASPFQVDRILQRFGKRLPVVGRWLEGLDVVLANARDVGAARSATGGALPRARPVRPSTGAGILAAPAGSGILATQRQ